ncbi:MAG: DNA alkylation repair protein [Candidatus Magasanikbacteria bacterium RIFCSPLOWO2_02_FULL_44_11]|uniref:DNA alkylation repair protein n=1 Tax=Candidatus Magasanikbacteria bacterium RIFCSPLOWO2_02_FULL_44_11 TaxID=1798689 RepID=A0A1F6NBG2_9BACT|nr:MAG: DNA alkylation repair protein [Candidatus Magasanikbacteria bacterium RIFCSPLOWO2_02_FULL_44_11]
MPVSLAALKKMVRSEADPAKAVVLKGFFKTGKGDYGEGDRFMGLTVPISRRIANKFAALRVVDIQKLLTSSIHEERLIALLMMVERFDKGNEKVKRDIYTLYIASTTRINNWDLVDLSADKIVGRYLFNHSRQKLFTLARSKNIWERRIAIIATFYFIKQNDFETTVAIIKLLLNDRHDLIHKSMGWMLREIGKRSSPVLRQFLNEYKEILPRTTVRYAIERFPEKERKKYLARS